jgi:hypothetical protein
MIPPDWQWLLSPAGAVYLRRRFVPSEYVRLVAWLRARAPFNHTRVDT